MAAALQLLSGEQALVAVGRCNHLAQVEGNGGVLVEAAHLGSLRQSSDLIGACSVHGCAGLKGMVGNTGHAVNQPWRSR